MIWQLYLAAFIIVAAYHDGMAELLRSCTSGSAELIERRNRHWHIAGATLYVIASIPLLAWVEWWRILIVGPLIRSCLFNPVRNITCMEPVWYIGHTSQFDITMRKISDKIGIQPDNSGWLLSAVSLLLLIIYNIFL